MEIMSMSTKTPNRQVKSETSPIVLPSPIVLLWELILTVGLYQMLFLCN